MLPRLDAYLEYYSPPSSEGRRRLPDFGGDQGPLMALLADRCADPDPVSLWTIGALPVTLNVRNLREFDPDFDAAKEDDRRHSKLSNPCAWPLFGPIMMIHQKKYVHGGALDEAAKRIDGICAKASRGITRGGLCWIGGADDADEAARAVACHWMNATHHPKGHPP